MTDGMWIILAIGLVCFVAIMYSALVAGSKADDHVERYWDGWGYKASKIKIDDGPGFSEHAMNPNPPEPQRVRVMPQKSRIDIDVPPNELRQDVALHHIITEVGLLRHDSPTLDDELRLARIEKFARLGLGLEDTDGGTS